MLGSCNNDGERLFLQRDASGDISVPCGDLQQHQIEGVRYLFSQYKKEKLGVIVNLPPGCGNCVQVTIFISAIWENLKKPVLILYDSDEEKEAWLERFAKWTDIGNEYIEVDAPNAYLKKPIFLKNIADLGTFYRRSWGIVVVKSDTFKNIFKKCQLKVDFKIWITAQDFKKDKQLLRLVYSWINPSDELLPQCIDRPPAVFQEDATNEVLLDILLQDTLFTRRNVRPFETRKRKRYPDVLPVLRLSAKNKDATGTKIKRSKKTPEVPTTPTIRTESPTAPKNNDNSVKSSTVVPKNTNDDNLASDVAMKTKKKENDDEESKLDVESFIRDNDPLKTDSNLSFAVHHLDDDHQIREFRTPKAEEASTESSLDFASAVADIIRAENNVSKENCDDSSNTNVEVAEDTDRNVTRDEVDVEDEKDSTEMNKIDFSEPLIQKVFYGSAEDRNSESDDQGREDKAEQKSSDDEGNGKADQKGKLEVSTIVMNETDTSFESKMKELEERALKKFKGSVLDKIF